MLARIVATPCAESIEHVDTAHLDRLLELAVAHRVTGSVTLALMDAGRALPTPLVELRNTVTANHLRTLGALDRAGRALDADGIRWAVVKGPVIAARWPGGWTERRYDDLDLLVEPTALRGTRSRRYAVPASSTAMATGTGFAGSAWAKCPSTMGTPSSISTGA